MVGRDSGSLGVAEAVIGRWWKPGKSLGTRLGQCNVGRLGQIRSETLESGDSYTRCSTLNQGTFFLQ